MALLLLFLFGGPAAAQDEPIADTPPRIGAAAWVDQQGRLDQGPEYALVVIESPRRPGLCWRISILAGARSGGAGVSSDLYTEETSKGEVRVSVGGGLVVDYDQAAEPEPPWRPVAFFSVRW